MQACVVVAADAQDVQRLEDDLFDAHARVERAGGVLEDHLHLAVKRLPKYVT